MRRAAAVVLVLVLAAAAAGWFLTAADPLTAADLPRHEPDVANGERMFYAGGCTSCHAAPGARGEDKLHLAGGLGLTSPFGTFRVPNISPDPESGIGGWSDLDFVNAVMRGVSPDGGHYYPSFPYPSYARMRIEDVLDMKAFIDTLPAVRSTVAGHDLAFPYSIRRGVGVWKRLNMHPGPVVALAGADPEIARGQYLVEGPGHCGECHTPRDALGGARLQQWLAGAPNPEGRGTIPNITPHADGIARWSTGDIAYSLETGFKPDFDSFGGSMVAVQDNMAKLPAEDRAAIAAYLKAVPPLPNAVTSQARTGAETGG